MKPTLLLSLTLIIAVSVFSQSEKPDMQVYNKAFVELTNGKRMKVTQLQFVNDTTLTFWDKKTQQQSQLNTAQINALWNQKGNYVVGGATFGGAVGLCTNLLALAMSNAEYGQTLPLKTTLPIITGFTLGAAGIGALVGWCIPKYTKISLPTNSKSTSFYFAPTINNQGYGVAVICRLK